MAARILVTGASGFLGRHVLGRLAARGYRVDAISSRQVEGDTAGTEIMWHRANLLDPKIVSMLVTRLRPTHLLHLAWYTEPGRYWQSPENVRWQKASIHLLQQFHDCGGHKVVMTGTCAEYAWTGGSCSELSTPCKPSSTYGECKYALCEALQAFCRQVGLNGAWARVFFLYGPGEHPAKLLPSMISTLLRDEVAMCRHGQVARDYLFVEDAAEALVTLVESGVEGPVNIASGKAITLGELVGTAADCLQARNRLRIGSEPIDDEPLVLCGDVHRLHTELRFQPQWDIQTGMAATVAWWKHRLAGCLDTTSCRGGCP